MRDTGNDGEGLKEVGRKALSVTGVGATVLVSPVPETHTVEKEMTRHRAFRRDGECQEKGSQQEVRCEQGNKVNT